METCGQCGETKPLERFRINSSGKRSSPCLDCRAAYMRVWRRARPRRRGQTSWQTDGRKAAYDKEWKDRHRDQLRAYYAEYARQHREVKLAHGSRRRARLRGAPVNDWNREIDWPVVLAEFGHRCAYCGGAPPQLQEEHMVPLVKGGSHTRANIVPACELCNKRKKSKTALQFCAERGIPVPRMLAIAA